MSLLQGTRITRPYTTGHPVEERPGARQKRQTMLSDDDSGLDDNYSQLRHRRVFMCTTKGTYLMTFVR